MPALQQANQHRQNPWQQEQRGQDPGCQAQRQQTAQEGQQAARPAAETQINEMNNYKSTEFGQELYIEKRMKKMVDVAVLDYKDGEIECVKHGRWTRTSLAGYLRACNFKPLPPA